MDVSMLINQQTKLFTGDSYDKYIPTSPDNMNKLSELIKEFKPRVDTRRYSYLIKQRLFFDDCIITYTITKAGRSWLELDMYQTKII